MSFVMIHTNMPEEVHNVYLTNALPLGRDCMQLKVDSLASETYLTEQLFIINNVQIVQIYTSGVQIPSIDRFIGVTTKVK